MAALKAAVAVMTVLIVVGVTVLVVTLVKRVSAPAAPATLVQATLDEPAGTRIAGMTGLADRLAVLLQGGGPDRVVVLDLRTGQVSARARLAR